MLSWKVIMEDFNSHKIIYYDFRKQQRDKEINEIQQRILDRLLNIGSYNDPDIQLQAKLDNLRLMKLEEEENQMQELLKLNKKGKIK